MKYTTRFLNFLAIIAIGIIVAGCNSSIKIDKNASKQRQGKSNEKSITAGGEGTKPSLAARLYNIDFSVLDEHLKRSGMAEDLAALLDGKEGVSDERKKELWLRTFGIGLELGDAELATLVRTLIHAGVDPNQEVLSGPDSTKTIPPMEYAFRYNLPATFNALLKSPKIELNASWLERAVDLKDFQKVQLLLNKGVEPNLKSLCMAIALNNDTIFFPTLLAKVNTKTTDINEYYIRDKSRRTLLHTAVEKKELATVKLLIAAGAKLNLRATRTGTCADLGTPLKWATRGSYHAYHDYHDIIVAITEAMEQEGGVKKKKGSV